MGGSERQAGGAAARWVLFVVAPLALVGVGLVLFVAAAPGSFLYARLVGGPTDAGRVWTGRVQLIERQGAEERPAASVPIRIEVRGPIGSVTGWSGRSDDEGWAEVRLERAAVGRHLDVCIHAGDPEGVVACGQTVLTQEAWRRGARVRSGQVPGRTEGELEIGVTVASGVLAVPFSSELQVTVSDATGPVEGAELTWRGTGLAVLALAPVRTDAAGRAGLRVTPREHVVSLALEATQEGARGSWFSTLPVVPGAMQALVEDGQLRVRSPVERESAWYSWVSTSERLGGGKLKLAPTPFGSAGAVPLPPEVPGEGAWVVVSSEPDARSPSAVGWPLGRQSTTFDVAEASLLDGAADAEAREKGIRRRVRWGASGFAALAAWLVALVFVREARRRPGRVENVDVSGTPVAGDAAWRLWVALSCIVLGFATILLIGLLWTR